MKKNFKQEKGITIIALTVVIIVLIILAGVSINLLLGENGLITRAMESSEDYTSSAKNEEDGMNGIDNQMAMLTIKAGEEVEDAEGYGENVKLISDGRGNAIPVPTDFYYVGGAKSTGFVISDVEGDDLENSKGGNQFVWIPVDGSTVEYARINYNMGSVDFNLCSESISEVERTSVEKYKGFYMGRYEAGDRTSTLSQMLRTSSSSDSNTVTVRKGQAPYNYISKSKAQGLAEKMASVEGYTTTITRLASSYAWDSALMFIKQTNTEYLTVSKEGNYKDTSFTYTDIKKELQTKESGQSSLVPTGQTTPVNNIYDLGGNVAEWTTETFSIFYIVRGSSYNTESTSRISDSPKF